MRVGIIVLVIIEADTPVSSLVGWLCVTHAGEAGMILFACVCLCVSVCLH